MDPRLNENIRDFYDSSTDLWEKTWGEHMHHGHYGADGQVEKDHYQAQVDLIEELLTWGRIKPPARILDMGCGIGGSSLHLAKKYNAEVVGITLSPRQVTRARERAAEAGLSDRVTFTVADALQPPYNDRSFDLIWSLESGEHIPDKKKLVQICHDLLVPGGHFLMATWCHRPVPPALPASEKELLERICSAYHLPPMVSIESYASLCCDIGFEAVQTADWSAAVAPFWKAVVKSVFRVQSLTGLVQSGWSTIRGALAMTLMIRGYREGLVRFGLLQGRKP